MALPPRYARHLVSYPSNTPPSVPYAHSQPHTLEFHLDYTCPYSAKFFRQLLPALAFLPSIPNPYGLKLIFRQQVQPWHPQSTLLHEAALVAERLGKSTDKDGWEGNPFWVFSKAAFEKLPEYTDHLTAVELRDDTYARLAKLLKETVGIEEEAALKELRLNEVTAENRAGNVGNALGADLKWHVKQARYASVHVSPTVLWDGIINSAIDSSWDKDKWVEFLTAELAKP